MPVSRMASQQISAVSSTSANAASRTGDHGFLASRDSLDLLLQHETFDVTPPQQPQEPVEPVTYVVEVIEQSGPDIVQACYWVSAAFMVLLRWTQGGSYVLRKPSVAA